MSDHFAHLSGVHEPSHVSNLLEELNELLNDHPQYDHASPLKRMLTYLIEVIVMVKIWVAVLCDGLHKRLLNLEKAQQPSTQTQTGLARGKAHRCKKCHARGHSAEECRTTDPSAI
jgi:hypothetical protein